MRWLGLFVVGPVLLTLGLAITVFYTEASQLMPSLKSVWLVIHVSVAILSVALFTIGVQRHDPLPRPEPARGRHRAASRGSRRP